MRLHALASSVMALGLIAASCVEATSQTQPAPSARAGVASMERYFLAASKQPKYDSLSAQEKRLLVMLAVSAATIVDSARCADPSVSGSAAEAFIFSIGMLRRRAPTILQVPRKTQLVELAMDMESQRPPSQDLTDMLCHGPILSDSASKSLAERRAAARKILVLGLAPPQSAPAPVPQR
jgi:hypothetical protein